MSGRGRICRGWCSLNSCTSGVYRSKGRIRRSWCNKSSGTSGICSRRGVSISVFIGGWQDGGSKSWDLNVGATTGKASQLMGDRPRESSILSEAISHFSTGSVFDRLRLRCGFS